ncbi:hypothetical protein B0O80DRAFT_499951, partial [Mortierella sp. GBAus27b]
MSTWISNYLASLGLGPEFEPYITGVLYDQSLTEEDKSATVYECLEENCVIETVNLQDAVAELFAQYAQGGLYWMEAPLYPYPSAALDFQYQPTTKGSRAIPIVRPPEDNDEAGAGNKSGVKSFKADNKAMSPELWARIDDDDPIGPADSSNGHGIRDALDPFDDDEFNPFAPPSAADLEMLNGTRNISYGGYHTATEVRPQYPPPIFYSADGGYSADAGTDAADDSSDQSGNLDQDMTPLEMLVLVIQDVSPDKIEKAFAKSGYDFERTLETLTAARSSGSDIVAPFMGDIRSTQTCRHFLQGNCFRKDCWYSHDLDSMVCKFWLKGQCLKGETCEFNHYIDTTKVTGPPPPPVQPKPPTMDDFPSLSASTSSSKNKGSNKGAKSNGKHDSKQNTVDSLASQLEEKVKVSSPPLAKPGISYSATAAAAASKPLVPLQRNEDTEDLRKAFKLEMAPTSIPWLETGTKLNSEYLKSRAKAIEYGKARNRCFELAAQAYLRNDGAAAAKLSAQGR